ncbi:MAG: DUF6714 family protein [Bacteroidota bacterium]
MTIDKEQLIAQIRSAFSDTSFPKNYFGIYSAEADDDYRSPTVAEAQKDIRLRWQDVTIQDMKSCPSALAHLNPDGFHYYLAAYTKFNNEVRK